MAICNRNEYEANKPTVYGIGIVGKKYPTYINRKPMKEYKIWSDIIRRCYSETFRSKHKKALAYMDAIVCDEWKYYPNFYEWLHSQENFDKWANNKWYAIDKDILVKNNRVYSPNTCCIVPLNVNNLFTNRRNHRGVLPVGVAQYGNKYASHCQNPFTKKNETLLFNTVEEAFQSYKQRKEEIIKQVAKDEYSKGNISKQCRDAMMNYIVEMTD